MKDNEAVRAILWVYVRALRRDREPRKRVLATFIAMEMWRTRNPRRLDRSELARQEARRQRWDEIRQREGVRVGDDVDHERAWGIFEKEVGGPRRLESWEWPPRAAKSMVQESADEDIGAIDDALRTAFNSYCTDPASDTQWFRCRVAAQHSEELRVRIRGAEKEPVWGAALALRAYGVMSDAAWYQIEVARRHAPRYWYCLGCEQWHGYKRGAPPKHHDVLMEMMLEAVKNRGVGHGDAKEVWRKVNERREGPTLRRWQAFVKEHHLKAGEWQRTLVRKRSPGRYRFVSEVVPSPSWTK